METLQTFEQVISQLSPAEWDQVLHILRNLDRPANQKSSEFWLHVLDELTSDVRLPTAQAKYPSADFTLDSFSGSSDSSLTLSPESSHSNALAMTQHHISAVQYGFESSRSTYFDFAADPPQRSPDHVPRHKKGISCYFEPDFKCKQSPLPIITSIDLAPWSSLCGRCGSAGDDLMIHCLRCCDPYHYYCAHLPPNVIPRLTVWYCHRCAICSVCGEGESAGRKFSWDIIETCNRCHEQFHINCSGSGNFMILYRDSDRETRVCSQCFLRTVCRKCNVPITGSDLARDYHESTNRICLVCRDSKERNVCKNCVHSLSASGLKKITCLDCDETFHAVCYEAFRHLCNDTGKSHRFSFSCKENIWSVHVAMTVIHKIRCRILQILNTGDLSGTERGDTSDGSSYQEPSTVRGLMDGDQQALYCEEIEIDFPIDSGETPSLRSSSSKKRHSPKVINKRKYHSSSTISAGPLQEPISSVDSPDSGLPASPSSIDSEASANPSSSMQSSNSLKWLLKESPCTKALLCHYLASFSSSNNSLELDLESGPAFFNNLIKSHPIVPLSDPFYLVLDYLSDCGDTSPSKTGETALPSSGIWNLILHRLERIRQSEGDCSRLKSLMLALHNILMMSCITDHFRTQLISIYEEVFRETRILSSRDLTSESKPRSPELIFPLYRFGNERPLLLNMCNASGWDFVEYDDRACMICIMAGDDVGGHCGRIISVGYDLWAHVGCLFFVSTRKRFWDYTLLKMARLDGPVFQRTVCLKCPIKGCGLIRCFDKNCSSAYHVNCASSAGCLFLPNPTGLLCPSHLDDPRAPPHVKPAFLWRKFTEMPIFGWTPPTNVKIIGVTNWSSMDDVNNVRVQIGSSRILSLGTRVDGWDSDLLVRPCGYRMERNYWSTRDPLQMTRYIFVILDINAHTELKSKLCEILQLSDIPKWEEKKSTNTKTKFKKSAKDSEEEGNELLDLPSDYEFPVIDVDAISDPPRVLSYEDILSQIANDDGLPDTLGCQNFIQKDLIGNILDICGDYAISNPIGSDIKQLRKLSPEIPVKRPPRTSESGSCGESRSDSMSPNKHRAHKRQNRQMHSSFDVDATVASLEAVDKFGVSENIPGGALSETVGVHLPGIQNDPQSTATSLKLRFDSPEISAYSPVKSPISGWGTVRQRLGLSLAAQDLGSSIAATSPLVICTDQNSRPRGHPRKIRDELALVSAKPALTKIEKKLTGDRNPELPPEKGKYNLRQASPDWSTVKRVKAVQDQLDGEQSAKIKPEGSAYVGLFPESEKMVTLTESPTVPVESTVEQQMEMSNNAVSLLQTASSSTCPQKANESPTENGSAPSIVSCLKKRKLLSTRRLRVTFADRAETRCFDRDYNQSPFGFIVNPEAKPSPGPYVMPKEDPDPNPDDFIQLKGRARDEITTRTFRRIGRLLKMLNSVDLTKISPEPSRLCLLVGEDGFVVASHDVEDCVQTLYTQIQSSRHSKGFIIRQSPGRFLDPLEFVCLSYPVTEFLHNQLPVNRQLKKSTKSQPIENYSEMWRLKLVLEPTCRICPLPTHSFLVLDGKTFIKLPVKCRQVLFTWKTVLHSTEEQNSAGLLRIRESLAVDTKDFPVFYKNIRHSQTATCVLAYLPNRETDDVTLAFLSRKFYPAWTEITFNPWKKPHELLKVLELKEFSCSEHNMSY